MPTAYPWIPAYAGMTKRNAGMTKSIKYLTKIIEYSLYLLVFLLPLQTRWIIKAGETEYTTYGLYGTDMLLIIILILYIIVIPAIEPESRGKIYKLNFLKKIFLNIINVYNIVISTVHSWIAGQARNDKSTVHSWIAGHKPASDKKELTSRNDKIIFCLIGGLILISAGSVFFAVDKPLALYKLGWLILGAGLFWLLVSANYDRVKLIYALLAGVFFQAGLAIWQFLTQSSLANKWLGLALHKASDLGASVIETVGADGVGERWLRAYGGLDHPNILGGLLAIGILMILYLSLIDAPAEKSPALRATPLLKGSIIIFAAALFFSFSRAAWLALAVGCAIMLGGAFIKKNFQAQRSILQAILVLGLVGFILFFQFPNLVMTRIYGGERLEVKSVNERLESLKSSWPIIKNNWAAGVGLGNYILALNRQAPGQESFYYQPAHNAFLLVWAETGIFGFIFFIGLLFVIARSLVLEATRQSLVKLRVCETSVARNDKQEIVARHNNKRVAILIALTVIMSLDHWLWSLHFGVLFFWLVLGMTAGSDKQMISK